MYVSWGVIDLTMVAILPTNRISSNQISIDGISLCRTGLPRVGSFPVSLNKVQVSSIGGIIPLLQPRYCLALPFQGCESGPYTSLGLSCIMSASKHHQALILSARLSITGIVLTSTPAKALPYCNHSTLSAELPSRLKC